MPTKSLRREKKSWATSGSLFRTFMQEALADVFQGVGEGPADADGFLGEAHGRLVVNPADLAGEEIPGQFFVRGVEGEGG